MQGKTKVKACHGIHLSHKKSMKIFGHMKQLCELKNYQNLMLSTSSDTKRTLVNLFLFTNSAQRELVSLPLTFLALYALFCYCYD